MPFKKPNQLKIDYDLLEAELEALKKKYKDLEEYVNILEQDLALIAIQDYFETEENIIIH